MRRALRGLVVGALAGGLCGCVAVPSYDAKTDQMLTQLQTDTDTLIANLSENWDPSTAAGKPCAYSANVKAFGALRVELSLITTRASALYNNGATVATLAHVNQAYADWETAHQHAETGEPSHCIIPALLPTEQRALDSAVGALMKLELVKKGAF